MIDFIFYSKFNLSFSYLFFKQQWISYFVLSSPIVVISPYPLDPSIRNIDDLIPLPAESLYHLIVQRKLSAWPRLLQGGEVARSNVLCICWPETFVSITYRLSCNIYHVSPHRSESVYLIRFVTVLLDTGHPTQQ